MANRHTHKKLRAEIHARMAATGEGYQRARHRILTPVERPAVRVNLVSFTSFGVPMTLVTSETDRMHTFALLGRAPQSAAWPPSSFWLPVMRFLRPRGVN